MLFRDQWQGKKVVQSVLEYFHLQLAESMDAELTEMEMAALQSATVSLSCQQI